MSDPFIIRHEAATQLPNGSVMLHVLAELPSGDLASGEFIISWAQWEELLAERTARLGSPRLVPLIVN
jgi:hypothetical protein